MKGKGAKLIIGIIFLIIAVVLYLLSVLNSWLYSWLCLALAIIGLILIVLSFGEKQEQPLESIQPDLSIQHEAPKVEEDAFTKEEPMEEVGVGASSNSDEEDLL